jgi:hypothetical protein
MIKHLLAILIGILLVSTGLRAQEFNDIIVTTASDTIHCKIGLVNNYNIFYTWNPKKKKIEDTFIARAEVNYFSSQDSSFQILEEEIPPPRAQSNFAENNGLIYPAALSSPPVFARGQNDLYYYLVENVRVYPRDFRVFGNNTAISLFEIRIDTTGKVTEATVYESAVQTGGFHYDCRYLESEIQSALAGMLNWTPAKVDGENVALTVFVPLRYSLENKALNILPSKYLFTFKNRE